MLHILMQRQTLGHAVQKAHAPSLSLRASVPKYTVYILRPVSCWDNS